VEENGKMFEGNFVEVLEILGNWRCWRVEGKIWWICDGKIGGKLKICKKIHFTTFQANKGNQKDFNKNKGVEKQFWILIFHKFSLKNWKNWLFSFTTFKVQGSRHSTAWIFKLRIAVFDKDAAFESRVRIVSNHKTSNHEFSFET
jgi:hypothetical protein